MQRRYVFGDQDVTTTGGAATQARLDHEDALIAATERLVCAEIAESLHLAKCDNVREIIDAVSADLHGLYRDIDRLDGEIKRLQKQHAGRNLVSDHMQAREEGAKRACAEIAKRLALPKCSTPSDVVAAVRNVTGRVTLAPEPKFNVGDRVRSTQTKEIGTVVGSGGVRVEWDVGCTFNVLEHRLEHAPELTFNVGDRVRIIRTGVIGTVAADFGGKVLVDGHHRLWYGSDELELV